MILFYYLLIGYLGYEFLKFLNILDLKLQSHYRIKKNKNIDIDNLNIKDFNKIRYKTKLIPENIDVIIIGSGISGLTCAGLLTKAGKKVLVLEQHDIAGGTMHSFDLKGIEHETGLHYIGNIKKRQKVLDLITDKKIEWCKLGTKENNYVYDEIFINDRHYKFEAGEENLKKYLISLFPQEEEGIKKYIDLIKTVAKRDLYFKLKCFPYEFISKFIEYLDPIYYKYCKKTTYNTISELINDEELIAVLCGQMGDYGLLPKESNFYTHASIVYHYLDGGYFPKGGTNIISENMVKFIVKNGGMVLTGKKVEKILIENNKCIGVKMENGKIIYSRKVVSSIGLRNTFGKLIQNDPLLINEKYIKKYESLKNNIDSSVYHIYCFLKLKGNPDELNLRSSNMWIYPHKNYDKLFKEYLEKPLEKPMPLFIAFSCKKDIEWKNKYPGYSNCVILGVINKNIFDEWEYTKCMKRGDSYNFLKELFGDRMIEEGLFKYFPQLKDKIEDINLATPLSTKYYFNSYYGESYGLDMSSERLLHGEKLRPKTDIKNFYLTGQDICTMGITGALTAGILTTNTIMNYDNFIDIILNNNIIKDLIKFYN